MHTKMVFQASRVLAAHGMPVLRFHFRGVGKSEGAYDHGRGEQLDVEAAMAFLRTRYAVPLVLAGFSFGATMVVKTLAAASHPEVERAVLLGLPVERGGIATTWQWRGPTLMISGDQDEFASVAALESYFAALPEPKARQWIAGGDHFMSGQAEAFRAALSDLLVATTPNLAPRA